ncbi:S41 family peptidase [Flavobacteriaceae bacterium]|nr:S41 family peptidase [Flavobacteriaceae bacterium]
MKKLLLVFTIVLSTFNINAQNGNIDKIKVQEDLNQFINNINNQYIYLNNKKVDLACIKEKYSAKINTLKNQSDVLLLFEYLLNEFYDNHIYLTTNINESYRLSSTLFVEIVNGKVIIKNVWQSQIDNLTKDILGAEIIEFNGIEFNKRIDSFPTLCNDKTLPEVRNWIANKIISGKYSEPRILTIKLKNSEVIEFNLNKLTFKKSDRLLSVKVENHIGIIRINNSLGTYELISEFDKALDGLSDTKGLIIDLRNTNSGGNTYVAKGIMSRFIDKELPYQKHYYAYSINNQPEIVRSWIELVTPRGKQYKKPVVVLVGRWTGSMGEGLAIGFDAMNRAEIVGTEMKRLAGSVIDFKFKNQNYGYRLNSEKLYHINGTPREEYIPKNYVIQTTTEKDETLGKGIELIYNINE